jgi:3-dehydroquinate synthase
MTDRRVHELAIDVGGRTYPILIGEGLLADRRVHERCVRASDVLVVTDRNVAPLYLELVRAALGDRRVATLVLPAGEPNKTLAGVAPIFDTLVEARVNRDGCVAALGGGVVGDMAGFAAACYQRGIDCVQLPTTLLAQVDSSVGGKTGVNHPGGKNLIGAFHQPAAVIADTAALRTLPPRELRAGLAEVVKYGLLGDAGFLDWVEAHADALVGLDMGALGVAIERSCAAKARIVAQDEREQGRRALLNLGHTFGHAIETATGYQEWLHGEAVAVGMLLAADLSARVGWLDSGDVARVRRLLERLGLPVAPPRIDVEHALALMGMDKKVQRGRLRLVLLRSLGDAVVTADFPVDALRATLKTHLARATA